MNLGGLQTLIHTVLRNAFSVLQWRIRAAAGAPPPQQQKKKKKKNLSITRFSFIKCDSTSYS